MLSKKRFDITNHDSFSLAGVLNPLSWPKKAIDKYTMNSRIKGYVRDSIAF